MMESKLNDLTTEDILNEYKRFKTYRVYDKFIVGFLIGVSIYSIINNGFGLLTFLPLIYLPVTRRNNKRFTALQEQLQKRGITS